MLWHGKSGIAIDATLFILIIGRGRSSAMAPEESVFILFYFHDNSKRKMCHV